MAVGMMTVGVAAEGLTLTVNNPDNSNVSIVNKTFNAYKVFDVTYTDTNSDGTIDDSDAVSYTIDNTNGWFLVITNNYMSTDANDDGDYVSAGKGLTLQKTHEVGVYNVITTDKFDARDFADSLVKYNNSAASQIAATKTVTGTAGGTTKKESAVFDGLEPGYYLITSEAAAADATNDNEKVVAAASLSNLFAENKEIEMKIGAPDIDKFIENADSATSPDTDGKGTAVNVGDTVDFKLTSNVPDTNGYDTYKFIITDTLSTGLDLVLSSDGTSPFTVTIKGAGAGNADVTVDLTEAGSAAACTGDNWFYNSNNRTVTISIAMLKNDGDKVAACYPEGKEIIVTYKATLNSNALTTGEENNTVNLEYSNDPYSTSTGKTTDKKTYVYDFEIVIDKYETPDNPDDADSVAAAKRLAGAEFILYRLKADGTTKEYYVQDSTSNAVTWNTTESSQATKVTTNENGSAKFAGLEEGTYYLQETKAPTGYNPLTEDVEVVITAVYNDNGTLKTGDGTSTTVTPISTENNTGYQIEADVANSSGSALPETGGIGTTIFYAVGGIMMVIAVVLLVTKKKMSSKK